MPDVDAGRLDVLKALGDNTRYAIYLELARSRSPRSTAEIAETLGLHPNTVRPHLERMRDVGLLEVAAEGRGTVGRPQHRYRVAADAPSLGLEPPAYPLLAGMLVRAAAAAGIAPAEAAAAGNEHGRAMGRAADTAEPGLARPPGRRCATALVAMLADLGFDPAAVADDGLLTVAFTHCPFQDLAEAHPEVVCHLHRGLIEGFVEEIGAGNVERFSTLVDRDPCQVELSFR
jgi:predicted ArsR family transcriptional regulator